MLRKSFGRRLKQLRKERHLTQDELAEAVDVSDSRIIRFWERGDAAPEFDNLEKLAEVLEVRVQDLFDFN